MTQREHLQTTLTNYFSLLAAAIVALLMCFYDLAVILYRLTSNLLALVGLIVWPILRLSWALLRGYIRFACRCGISLHKHWKRLKRRTERKPAEPKEPAAMGDFIFAEWTANESVEVPA